MATAVIQKLYTFNLSLPLLFEKYILSIYHHVQPEDTSLNYLPSQAHCLLLLRLKVKPDRIGQKSQSGQL